MYKQPRMSFSSEAVLHLEGNYSKQSGFSNCENSNDLAFPNLIGCGTFRLRVKW